MQSLLSPMTIADFCASHERKEITINYDYQRNPDVWPDAARSFLIETILLGFPMPKLFIRQKTDVRSKTTTKEVVDGQQRTNAILEFFRGAFPLSRRAAPKTAAHKRYAELDEDLQGK